jgi:hypothetical protein
VLTGTVAVFNRALTAFFDVVLWPIDRLPPMAGLAVLSLLTAAGVLLAFKWTADQHALARTKRAIQAAVFEMRLFNDDLPALFRAQGDVLRHTAVYLRLSLAPTLWLLVPMLALMLHMEYRFGYTGLEVGHPVLVTVHFNEKLGHSRDSRPGDHPQDPIATLEAPDGLRVETPAVSLPSAREITWRIRPGAAGSYRLVVRLPDAAIPKSVLVSSAVGRRSPERPGAGFFDQLLNPSEPPIPDARIAGITVGYPERAVVVAGWNIGWSGVFLGLTLVFALALKRPMRVEI